MLLGIAGGIAAVLLFTSGVTRRAARLEENAERLAGGQPLLPPLPDGDALGTPGFWVAQLHPDDLEPFTAKLEQAIADQAPQVEQEYRFLLLDGYHWLYGVTRLVYDDDGPWPTPSATPWTSPSASRPTTPCGSGRRPSRR